jgi:2'-5' RNA ligase
LFFALWPDAAQRARLRDIVSSEAKHLEGRAVDRGNWHVTLVFIGNSNASLVPVLLARAAELPVTPFRLRFDRIEYWARPRIACLVPSTVPAELTALHDSLNALMIDLGHTVETRSYRPHVTLLRAARPFAAARLAQPATFEFGEFELVESRSAAGGVRYIPLKQ